MSTLITGNDGGVTITRYARGLDKNGISIGYGYQVTWHTDRGISHLSFDNIEKAKAFFHLVYLSLDVA